MKVLDDIAWGAPVELRHYFAILRSRAALLLLFVLASVAVAWVVTPKSHKYSAQAVIYVGARQFSVSPGSQYNYDPTLLVQRLMQTYAQMLDSEPIATDALHATSVPRTPKQVVKESDVTPGTNTQLLSIAVTDRVPAVAQKLANGIADTFIRKAQTLDVQPGPGSLPSLPAYIFRGRISPSPLSRPGSCAMSCLQASSACL